MKATGNNLIFNMAAVLLLMLPAWNAVTGQEPVTLEAHAPTYGGETIGFYTYTDYITKDTTLLCRSKAGPRGHFSCRFTLEQTRKVFTDLGPYKGYFYAEPGKQYMLNLPEKEKKTQAQQLNPFFEGIPVHIGISNATSNELNYHINQFNQLYDRIVKKNLNNIKGLGRKRDSVIRLLDTAVKYNHPFFKQFKKYKLAGIKLPLGFSPETIKKVYFDEQPVLYNNPAYMKVFSTLYGDYFKDLFTRYGGRLYWIINRKQSYTRLDTLCMHDSLLAENQRLREMVILKGLNSAYHEQGYVPEAVAGILDAFLRHTQEAHHMEIARRIKQTNKLLQAGEKAPGFCLYDTDSSRVCLKDFEGEYILVGFCNSKNYSCIRDYRILENLQKRHRHHFRVVIISNNRYEDMVRYAEHHDLPFLFLHYGEQKNILNHYQVKTMPTYYFIGPAGELMLAPAPPPAENLEKEIYRKMKTKGDL